MQLTNQTKSPNFWQNCVEKGSRLVRAEPGPGYNYFITRLNPVPHFTPVVEATLTFLLLGLILYLDQRHKCLQIERECGLELHLKAQEFGLAILEATPSTCVTSPIGRRPSH